MGNSESTSTPLSKGFQLFPRFPNELQAQIWKTAADVWIEEHLDLTWYWTTSSGKRVHLFFIDVDSRENSKSNSYSDYSYILKFPDLLFVNTAARNIMYDALLGAGDQTHAPVPRGEDVHVFLKSAGLHKDFITSPQLYGWQIQDFRYPDLQKRVQAEEERLKELGEEILEVQDRIARHRAGGPTNGEAAGLKAGTEGYVRLPLFSKSWATYRAMSGRVMQDVYPEMPEIKSRSMRDRDHNGTI